MNFLNIQVSKATERFIEFKRSSGFKPLFDLKMPATSICNFLTLIILCNQKNACVKQLVLLDLLFTTLTG